MAIGTALIAQNAKIVKQVVRFSFVEVVICMSMRHASIPITNR